MAQILYKCTYKWLKTSQKNDRADSLDAEHQLFTIGEEKQNNNNNNNTKSKNSVYYKKNPEIQFTIKMNR